MKGILFTEILFNKTIRKEKTMTRRAPASLKVINENPDAYRLVGYNDYGSAIFDCDDEYFSILVVPTYKVGEVVYIKEPVGVNKTDCSLAYMYDYAPTDERRTTNKKDWNWGNKMFMKAALARHYIRITNVKVERLYDISDEDCLKEGVDVIPTNRRKEDIHLCEFVYPDYEQYKPNSTIHQRYEYTYSPKISFFSLFRFANRVPKSKEIPNLWVFCYSYCLCDINGNKL